MTKLKDVFIACGKINYNEKQKNIVIPFTYKDNKSKIKLVEIDETFTIEDDVSTLISKYFNLSDVVIYNVDRLLFTYLDMCKVRFGKESKLYTYNKEVSEHRLKRFIENTEIDNKNISKFNKMFLEAYNYELLLANKIILKKGIYYEEKTF